MRTYEECIPCLASQIRRVTELSTKDRKLRTKIITEALMTIGEMGFDKPPPHLGQLVYRLVKERSGNPDPYGEFKQHFNRVALQIYPELKNIVTRSTEPFRTAVLISLAGNIIDFGPDLDIKLLDTIRKTLEEPPFVDSIPDLERALRNARTVLFIGDNAGEVVFDRLLVESAPSNPEYFYAVRGGTVINDATIDDAMACGLDRVCTVLSTGSDAPGVILGDCSKSFLNVFKQADVVIAKGMGNFETLCDVKDKDIYFILLAKCQLVARQIGCPVGGGIVKKKAKGDALFESHGGSSRGNKKLSDRFLASMEDQGRICSE